MRLLKYRKTLLLIAGFAAMMRCQAQDAAAAATPAPASSNSTNLVYVCLGAAIVLLIAIGVLSQVLIRLSMYAYENNARIAKVLVLAALMFMGGHTAFADGTAATATVAAAPAGSGEGFSLQFLAIIAVLTIEALVLVVLLIRIMSLVEQINPKGAEASKGLHIGRPTWFDRFNKSVAVEQEKDIMLDHDYDGIKELDNALPPWWKYGFIFTIIWSVVYLTYFHVMHAAPLSTEEYTNEMAAAKAAKDALMKTSKNNVDENSIVFDASMVPDGKKIYTENCSPCHGPNGQGVVGPNLTDNYWLHGGKINDIFKTVKYGWPANGMKSWQNDLSPMQIAQVVCYVKSLKGTNPPNPKAPQGELYNEDGGGAASGAVKDSTSTASAAPKDSLSK